MRGTRRPWTERGILSLTGVLLGKVHPLAEAAQLIKAGLCA